MAKYIRTKDEIFELYAQEKRLYGDFISPKHKHYRYDCIIKQADTIEELCDVFVLDKNLYYRIEDLKWHIKQLKELNKWSAYMIKPYGAIWTDKGLIYVAKMNKEGELELI